jgi:hypothetical protein
VKPTAHRKNQANPDVRSLVLRAWLESGSGSRLRVRIVEIASSLDERPVLATASVEEACRAVRHWLDAQEDDAQQEHESAPGGKP